MTRRSLPRPRPPRFPDHPQAEHDRRVARARALMALEGLDAVVFARNANVYYMTGSRFLFVGFDQPFALAPQTAAIVTRDADVYCQRFGPFDSDDVSIDTTLSASLEHYESELELPDILSDYGIGAGARVGIECGDGPWTGIAPPVFEALRRRLERDLGVAVVDSNPLVRALTAVKSPFEIGRMTAAVEAATRALNRLIPQLAVGMRAPEVARLASVLMLEEGAEQINHTQVMSEGDGAQQLMSSNPVDQPLVPGWVHVDLGCRVGRYTSDVNRGLFLGREPTAREVEVHAVRRGVNDLLDTLIRPGVPIESVVAAAQRYVEDHGLRFSIYGGYAFAGHSIGMETHAGPNLVSAGAQPRLAGGSRNPVFEEGMTFAYECTVMPAGGERVPFFNVEDDVVVTADGVRNLSAELGRELTVRA